MSLPLTITVESFSYKNGVPLGADIVMDCRFLRNPFWQDGLRDLDGRSDDFMSSTWSMTADGKELMSMARDASGTSLNNSLGSVFMLSKKASARAPVAAP